MSHGFLSKIISEVLQALINIFLELFDEKALHFENKVKRYEYSYAKNDKNQLTMSNSQGLLLTTGSIP